MAKKSAKKSAPPSVSKWVTPEAKERYESVMKNRALLQEKCFYFSGADDLGHEQYIWYVVMAHDWRRFAGPPHPVAENLVREFYASMPKDGDSVIVRGKEVDITEESINAFYHLSPKTPNNFDYPTDPDEIEMKYIVNTLCVHGTEWEVTNSGFYSLKYNTLKAGAKIWLNVLKSKLIPSTHCGTITKNRAILLYCIVMGKPINVGKIISAELKVNARKNKGALSFPSLITGLCVIAGCEITPTEIKPAEVLMTKKNMALILRIEGPPEGEGDEERAESASGAKRKIATRSAIGKSKLAMSAPVDAGDSTARKQSFRKLLNEADDDSASKQLAPHLLMDPNWLLGKLPEAELDSAKKGAVEVTDSMSPPKKRTKAAEAKKKAIVDYSEEESDPEEEEADSDSTEEESDEEEKKKEEEEKKEREKKEEEKKKAKGKAKIVEISDTPQEPQTVKHYDPEKLGDILTKLYEKVLALETFQKTMMDEVQTIKVRFGRYCEYIAHRDESHEALMKSIPVPKFPDEIFPAPEEMENAD